MNEQSVVDPKRWLALIVVLAATLMSLIDSSIVNVAAPSIQTDLHTDTAQLQLVIVGYTLAYAVGLVTGGRLGDMLGRKRIFQSGMLIFVLTSLLCGCAPTPIVLILSRVLQGLGSALMVPQVISIIQISFLPEEKPVAFSIYGTALGIGGALGQILGGVLIVNNFMGFAWRNIFFVNIPIGVLALIASVPLVRESRVKESQKLDLVGVVLFALGLILLIYPLSVGREAGWPLWSFCCLFLSIPLFVLFAYYEHTLTKRSGSPLIPTRLFKDHHFTLGLITGLTFYSTIASLFLTLSIFEQNGHGFTPLQSGIAFIPLAISFVLGSLVGPRLAKRQKLKILYYGILLSIIGYGGMIFLVSFLGAYLYNPLSLAAPLFFIGIGQGFTSVSLINVIVSNVPRHYAGAASGIVTTINQVSQGVGVALIGIVFFGTLGVPGKSVTQLSSHYNQAFIASVGTLIGLSLLSLVTLFLLMRIPQQREI